MKDEKCSRWNPMFFVSVCMIAVSLTAFVFIQYYSRIQFQVLGHLCGEILEKQPESRQAVMESMKEWERYSETGAGENPLASFGYEQSDFIGMYENLFICAVLGTAVGIGCFLLARRQSDRKLRIRTAKLTDYLEKVTNQDRHPSLLLKPDGSGREEDALSGLQDEIYKTVTMLYQTREEALQAKHHFAENLSNIAHQLKTPITAISLSAQMIEGRCASKYTAGIQKQVERLACFEESLLTLSRIDAGTLELKRDLTDVFTLLTLAADHLQELAEQAETAIYVPEEGEILFCADLDWTMEAVMNLMKNCVEHAPAQTVVECSYEENPLYVQIHIWDRGEGFAKEDLPHLFERFYCGKRGKKHGIGIGLSLAESIIEMQNGVIRAYNRPDGGACFEIRFYRH